MSTPPVSITTKRFPAHSATSSLRSRVTPGVSCTTAARDSVRRLTSVDLPTFGKPTIATVPASGWLRSSSPLVSSATPPRLEPWLCFIGPASSRSPRLASGRLAGADELLDPADDVLDVELRRVDQDRVVRGLHARGVALVAQAQVSRERVGADLGALGEPPLRADVRRGVQVDLHDGVGDDDGADVAPLDHRVTSFRELALALAHIAAHLAVTGNHGHEPIDVDAADRGGDV